MQEICDLCGAVIAVDLMPLHLTWHAGIEPIRDDPDPIEEIPHE